MTYAFHVVELDHVSHGSCHTVGIEDKLAAIANIDHDGLGLGLGRQARDAQDEAEDLHHDGKALERCRTMELMKGNAELRKKALISGVELGW